MFFGVTFIIETHRQMNTFGMHTRTTCVCNLNKRFGETQGNKSISRWKKEKMTENEINYSWKEFQETWKISFDTEDSS